MKTETIVLKGQKYVAPKTESVEIISQGVLCASGGGMATTSRFGKGTF